MSLDFQRLEQVLAEAVARADPAERAAYLAEACGEDRELRAEVERLLAANEQAGDFLETPVKPASEPLPGERSERTEVLPESDIALEQAGAMIGRYKLLEEIGEGGFGVVYMAEQTEPVHRRVALKVVKAGMDTREVVARFEAERQALALMDHPNIARVFDGGVTQAGRPYFVMELVPGIPITGFCDQRNLPTRERLRLFIQVCHAVQHAHQKGIIHRDLKPSNILVTLIDGEPVPKVIDFGVAKALGQKLTDKTLFTGFLKMVGTPAYMSPEQADLSGVDIDTRSDIYALGVLLYELLTGVTPFDAETLRNAALDEIRRLIRETEPPRPSTRLQTLGEKLTTVAQRRQTEPAALNRLVRGDLDWIVMKALEKERSRRYETANGLAMDVQCFLDDQPVAARPPSRLYRLQKTVRHHRVAFVAVGAVLSALLLGLALSTWLFIRERRAYENAAAQRSRAEMEARKSATITAFLQKTLASPDPSNPGFNMRVADVLSLASSALEKDFPNQPEIQGDLRTTLGRTYQQLQMFKPADAELRRAVAFCRQSLGEAHPVTLSAMEALGNFLLDRNRLAEAEGLHRRVYRQRLGLGADHPDTLRAELCLADTLAAEDRLSEAEPLALHSLPIRAEYLLQYVPPSASAFHYRCAVFASPRVAAAARQRYSRELALTPQAKPELPRTIIARYLLAKVLCQEGRNSQALDLLAKVRQSAEVTFGIQHLYVLYMTEDIGHILIARGDTAAAAADWGKLYEARQTALGHEHPATLLAGSYYAWSLAQAGRLQEAIQVREQDLRACERVMGPANPMAIFHVMALGTYYDLAGQPERGEAFARRALGLAQQEFGEDDNVTARCRERLRRILQHRGKVQEANHLAQVQEESRRRVQSSTTLPNW
jgi:serine/threonine protein kinase